MATAAAATIKRSETADSEQVEAEDLLPELSDVMTRSDCVLGQPHTPSIEPDLVAKLIPEVFSATAGSSSHNGSLLLLDCRSLSEFQSGHIEHSVHISLPGLIYKRLMKGSASPLCVLPINTQTLPARQRMQSDAAAVQLVVVASTQCPISEWSSHRGGCEHSAQADFECASMTIGRLLVSRFLRLGCSAALLNGGFLAFQIRHAHLCTSTDSDQPINNNINTAIDQSIQSVPQSPDQKHTALRPSQLGPLLSLADLTLTDPPSDQATQSEVMTSTGTHSEVAATTSNSSTHSQSSSCSQSSQATATSDNSTSSSMSVPSTSSANSSPRARMVFRACILDSHCADDTENRHMGLLPGHQMMPSRRLSSSAPAPCSPLLQPSYLNDAFEKCSGAMHSAFPVHIVDNVYLGNANNSVDRTILDQHNIRYILNVTPNLPNQFADEKAFHYLQVPVSDHWSQSLIPSYMPQCIAFIEEARTENCSVLIHCLAGISRSVTITVAYLMQTRNLTLDEAYDWVKQRKANIAPNFNFMGQLLDFERQLRNGSGSPDSGQFSSDEGDSHVTQAPAIRLDGGGPAQKLDISSQAAATIRRPASSAGVVGTNNNNNYCKYSTNNYPNEVTANELFKSAAPIRLTQPPVGRKRQQPTKVTDDRLEEPRAKSPEVELGDSEKRTVKDDHVTQSKCLALAGDV